MKKIFLIFIITIFLLPLGLKAQEKISVDYFYGIGCPHCAKVKPFLEEMKGKYPQIEFREYEVYQNRANALKLLEKQRAIAMPLSERGVPVIFLPDKYFVGDAPIIDNLENELKRIIKTYIGEKPKAQEPKSPQEPAPVEEPSGQLSFLAITTAALADSINPCAIAVLMILLSALMMTNDKKRAIFGGLAFILSIYISYFLFGLGVLKAIQFANVDARIIYKIVGVIAILIGLFNLKDFFWYGKGFVMEIPRRWRPTLQALLRRITSPLGAFLIGFVVVLFELPCTGGPYFFVLGLLSQHKSYGTVIPWLIYYNLFFVLPLLILAFLIYFGQSTIERAQEWKNKNIRLLHFITGLIMLALGVWVFFS